MTVHHPSCPWRNEYAAVALDLACLCGPEAAAEDAVILAERTPDTMLLDVVAHAEQSVRGWCHARAVLIDRCDRIEDHEVHDRGLTRTSRGIMLRQCLGTDL